MRRVVFALVIFLVCASAATGVRVHASTECERWIAEYRNALAHSPAVKRVNAAQHRLHHYIHRKIATLTKPKPKKPRVLPVRHRGPRMTREEMLRKFELACGDLPVESTDEGNLAQDPAPAFAMNRETGDLPLDLDSGDDGPGMLLAMNEAPSYLGGGSSPEGSPGFFLPPFGGLPPGGGGQKTTTVTDRKSVV